ncbi:MAG TPA: transposase [Gaiellaceae bacterium]|nr:transposase [Gaiellaceae bacterium]
MPRPPRVQFPSGIFHLTGRGNRRQRIYLDDHDYVLFLQLLDRLAAGRGWIGYAYCLMPNHYHLVVQTPRPDLSAGMQWLNGRYAQMFNIRHAFDGHLFQGRFHSVVVESDWHLLELARYLPRNPIRAGLCRLPGSWPWSSYLQVAGVESPRRFLDTGQALAPFGKTRPLAQKAYRRFVEGDAIGPQA